MYTEGQTHLPSRLLKCYKFLCGLNKAFIGLQTVSICTYFPTKLFASEVTNFI